MISKIVRRRILLIVLAVAVGVSIFTIGLQRLQAQNAPKPDAAKKETATAPAPSPPPSMHTPLTLEAIAPDAKEVNIKNWDGGITKFLSFNYKSEFSESMNVLIPASFKGQTKTRLIWTEVFRMYDMTDAYRTDEYLRKNPPMTPELQRLINELSGGRFAVQGGTTGTGGGGGGGGAFIESEKAE